MPVISEIIYKDIPLSFTAHPMTGNLSVVTNVDAVKNAVKNIVLTNFYERPYSPDFGGNVNAQMFENADPFTEYSLTKNIKTALKNYEPRAIVDDVIVKSDPDSHYLTAKIIFRLKNNKEPIEVSVFLERVR